MNTSDVLNKAADLIEERGWTYGEGWDAEVGQPLCVEGAIRAALGWRGSGVLHCQAATAVANHVGRVPWMWNDDLVFDEFGGHEDPDSATRQHVIETLRAAAIIAAAQEVDVRVVAPEAELTAVSLADVAGAVTA